MIFLTGLISFFAGMLLVNVLGDPRRGRTNGWDHAGGLMGLIGLALMIASFLIMLFRHLP